MAEMASSRWYSSLNYSFLLLLTACGTGSGDGAADSADTVDTADTADTEQQDSSDTEQDENTLDESELATIAQLLCGLYERCDAGLLHAYGTGEECVWVYTEATKEAVRLEPLVAVVYEELANCSELTSAACSEPGLFAEARWLNRLLVSCTSSLIAAEGDPCNGGGCGSGLECKLTSAEACGVCEAAPAGWCSSDVQCALGEFCNDETESCQPAVELGEACESSKACRSGTCLNEICTLEAELGESCTEELPCASFLECIDGECKAAPGEGEACTEPSDCRYAFACIDGTCQTLTGTQPLGGPCRVVGNDCGAEAFCDLSERVCRSNEIGAACSIGCGTTRRCVEEVCAPLLSDGEACGHGSECSSGRCFEDTCASALTCWSLY